MNYSRKTPKHWGVRRKHAQEARRLQAELKKARKKAGLTQVEVAKRLGVQQDLISKYETGERRLDVIELFAVLKALEQDPLEFLRKFFGKDI